MTKHQFKDPGYKEHEVEVPDLDFLQLMLRAVGRALKVDPTEICFVRARAGSLKRRRHCQIFAMIPDKDESADELTEEIRKLEKACWFEEFFWYLVGGKVICTNQLIGEAVAPVTKAEFEEITNSKDLPENAVIF